MTEYRPVIGTTLPGIPSTAWIFRHAFITNEKSIAGAS